MKSCFSIKKLAHKPLSTLSLTDEEQTYAPLLLTGFDEELTRPLYLGWIMR
jgi:hypothetical protein